MGGYKRARTFCIGPHRLVRGDCVPALKRLTSESVDVVVTSPPYNIGLSYFTYDDRKEEGAYLAWMQEVCAQIKRVLRPDGSFFLNVSGSSSSPWLPFELAVRLRGLFCLQNHISWVKSISIGEDTFGHFKPINSARFLHHNHEHLFHFTLDGQKSLDRLGVGVPYKDKSNIRRRHHDVDRRCRGDVWFIPYKTVRSKSQKYNHPGTFPLELPQTCIRLHGVKNPVVLDPFAGTGTTLIATHYEGGEGIGIEIDSAYVTIARQRLEYLLQEESSP
ncbi:DNA-methyltransferase [Entomobacter blattae]|nr:site-specific DNA-methyltransferase [Entomobacter blattae]